MDSEHIRALAQAAGLDKALASFPDDVAAAVKTARDKVKALTPPADPLSEPWPPIRLGDRP